MLPHNPPPLSDADIAAALANLPGWVCEGDMLCKTYPLPTYAAGLIWATSIGALAERLDHHPDILIGWKRVTVRFTTHSVGHKITANDVQSAQQVELLAALLGRSA